MKNFRLYEITDFVIDEDFIRWVQHNNENDRQFWKKWLDENPDKHLIVAEARSIVELMPCKTVQHSSKDIAFEADRLLHTIRQPVDEPVRGNRPAHPLPKWWYAAAAMMIVMAGSLYFLMPGKPGAPPFSYHSLTAKSHLTEQVNKTNGQLVVNLPDGSRIELSKDSRISYAANFDSSSTRDIYLSGEAFFKVAKNPDRPFRVFANEIVTKVLGTSFTVRSYDTDSLIKITVRTGKVSVYDQQSTETIETTAPNKLGGLIVTPNQQLVYERAVQKFKKILLDNPSQILTKINKADLVYDDTPLEKVFNDLGKAYGINIVFDPETISGCTVTADLNIESFYQKLDLVCRAVGAQYTIADGQVVINSDGCK